MNCYAVLPPMGFDSSGLPAEKLRDKDRNTTRDFDRKKHREIQVNIKSSGSVTTGTGKFPPTHLNTTDGPHVDIFLKLYEKGLAYEAEMSINFCPSCKTGLANEEVKDGKCDRCGSQVSRKSIRQWMLKITEYAERLLGDLDTLDWTEAIKAMQRNWIGRSEGANVIFPLENGKESIEVYTTRPDTLFGATYMVLAPEHPLVKKNDRRA
jgi:leucyl-tRNA synthetase